MITRIRHLIFDHFVLKIVALLIAFLMWYAVANEPVAEISLPVPIEFTRPPKNLDYSSDVLPQAQVLLRGPARVLHDLPEQNVNLIIDLQGAVPGEHTYSLTAAQVRVPRDVQILQITPNRLRLVFDTPETRQIAVKPRIVGVPAAGLRIATVVTTPSTVTISGPAHHVSAVEAALTDAVDVSGITGPATFETRAYVPDPLVHLSGPGSIHVAVVTTNSSSNSKNTGAHRFGYSSSETH